MDWPTNSTSNNSYVQHPPSIINRSHLDKLRLQKIRDDRNLCMQIADGLRENQEDIYRPSWETMYLPWILHIFDRTPLGDRKVTEVKRVSLGLEKRMPSAFGDTEEIRLKPST
jgi:hypothetical protein